MVKSSERKLRAKRDNIAADNAVINAARELSRAVGDKGDFDLEDIGSTTCLFRLSLSARTMARVLVAIATELKGGA